MDQWLTDERLDAQIELLGGAPPARTSMHDRYVNLSEIHLRAAFLSTTRLHETQVDEQEFVKLLK